MAHRDVRVSLFDPRYAEAFARLNYEWIETYFAVEEMDRFQLRDPQKTILNEGGEIFFILENEMVVGTCALVPHGKGRFELAKMAVTPTAKGCGYGDLLMRTAIEWAEEQGADSILLLSNTLLEPAINLYKKHGFETTCLGPQPDYQRCDIEMKLTLNKKGRGSEPTASFDFSL